MKTFIYYLFCIFVLLPSISNGTTDFPRGPHNGLIKMTDSGDFYTEILRQNKEYHVYLLDKHMQESLVKNASVSIEYVGQVRSPHISCLPKNNYFVCKAAKGKVKGLKEIVLHSQRETSEVSQTTYPFPFPRMPKKLSQEAR